MAVPIDNRLQQHTKATCHTITCCAKSSLSARAAQLIQEQQENPIFQPDLLTPPLSTTLNSLQSATPPRFVTIADLPPTPEPTRSALAAQLIADKATRAVQVARESVTSTYPGITEAGGALYPAYREEACWRDLMQFMRVAGYVCVAGDAFSSVGLSTMRSLYVEMGVPLDALITGVESARDDIMCDAPADLHAILLAAFTALLVPLKAF